MFNWLKKTGSVLKDWGPVVAGIAGAAGVPYASTIAAIIKQSNIEGVPGRDRMTNVVNLIMADSSIVFTAIEKKFGKKIPEAAATAYVRSIAQAHYDLLKEMGELE